MVVRVGAAPGGLRGAVEGLMRMKPGEDLGLVGLFGGKGEGRGREG